MHTLGTKMFTWKIQLKIQLIYSDILIYWTIMVSTQEHSYHWHRYKCGYLLGNQICVDIGWKYLYHAHMYLGPRYLLGFTLIFSRYKVDILIYCTLRVGSTHEYFLTMPTRKYSKFTSELVHLKRFTWTVSTFKWEKWRKRKRKKQTE